MFLGGGEEGDVCMNVEGMPSGGVVKFVIARIFRVHRRGRRRGGGIKVGESRGWCRWAF